MAWTEFGFTHGVLESTDEVEDQMVQDMRADNELARNVPGARYRTLLDLPWIFVEESENIPDGLWVYVRSDVD